MTFRKTLFWVHLVTGLLAALIIAMLSFTGAALAFQEELIAWAERDARRVEAPANPHQRRSIETLQLRVQTEAPTAKNLSITLRNHPEAAVAFGTREKTWYADPYTGTIKQPASRRMHAFMDTMVDWHRWLALKDKGRDAGRAITGAANLMFLALTLTGLILWWPRAWSWKALKPLVVPSLCLRGKARDWNWHNSLGLLSAPILSILILTAVPISYRWGNDLLYRMVSEVPPVQNGPGGMQAPPPRLDPPAPGTPAVSPDRILAETQAAFPRWEQITLRSGGGRRDERAAPGPQPLTVMVKEAGAWPRTAATTLTVHPYTGQVLTSSGFKDMSLGRRLRVWARFLHTGQAVGPLGQLFAGLACLAALVLVYTGVALSWRRFFAKN